MEKTIKNIKKRYKYSADALKNAIASCKSGQKIAEASKMFGVPVSTLSRKLSLGIDYVSKPGKKPLIGNENETKLVNWIMEGGAVGAPKSRSDIKYAAWGLSSNSENQLDTGFGPKGPSDGWMYKFLKRHSQIRKRKPENLSAASAAINLSNIENWFSFVESYLRNNDLLDILSDPARIINMDEAGFEHNPSSGYVFVNEKQRNVYEVSKNSKDQTTVLWGFQANGQCLKPHIVFAGKRYTKEMKINTPDSVTIGLTETGWMTQKHFTHYIEDILYPELKEKAVEFPVIVFLDGHTSHDSIEVAEKSKSLGIILIRLYPNSTHVLQPADRGIFYPIKTYYSRAIKINKLTNKDFVVNKTTFPHLMDKCCKMLNSETIKTAFETCGLYPFRANAIKQERFLNGNEYLSYKTNDVHDSQMDNEVMQSTDNEVMQSRDNDVSILYEPDDQKERPSELQNSNPKIIIEDSCKQTCSSIVTDCDNDVAITLESDDQQERSNVLQNSNPKIIIEPCKQMFPSMPYPSNEVVHSSSDENHDVTPKEINGDKVSCSVNSFKIVKSFMKVDNSLAEFKKIIGPERVLRYENPEDAKQFREVDIILEQTYNMLKRKHEEDERQFELLQHEEPKRKKSRIIRKKHFVTSSVEYIEEEKENRLKKCIKDKKVDKNVKKSKK